LRSPESSAGLNSPYGKTGGLSMLEKEKKLLEKLTMNQVNIYL